MPQCFVLNCGNRYHKTRRVEGNKIVQYHVFPSDTKLAEIWALRCRGVKTTAPVHTRVCSDHFSPANYKRDLQHELLGLPLRRILLPGSIPDMHLPEPSVEILNTSEINNSAVMNIRSGDKCEDCNNVHIDGVCLTRSTQSNVERNGIPPAKRVKPNDFIPIIDLTVSPEKTVSHTNLQVTMNKQDTSVDRDIRLTPRPSMLFKTPKLLEIRTNKIVNIKKRMPCNIFTTYPPGDIVSEHNLEMNTSSKVELSSTLVGGKCLQNKPQNIDSKRNSNTFLNLSTPLRSSTRIAIKKSNEMPDVVESPVKDKTKFLMKLSLKRVTPVNIMEVGSGCNPSEAAATPGYRANKNRKSKPRTPTKTSQKKSGTKINRNALLTNYIEEELIKECKSKIFDSIIDESGINDQLKTSEAILFTVGLMPKTVNRMLVMEEPEGEFASKEDHPDSPLSTSLSSDAPKNDNDDPISTAESNVTPNNNIDSKNEKVNIKISNEISDKSNNIDRNGDEQLVPENNTIPDLVEDKLEEKHAEEMEKEETKSDDITAEIKSDEMNSTKPEEVEEQKVSEVVNNDTKVNDNIPVVTANNLVIIAHSVIPKSNSPSAGSSPKQFPLDPSNDVSMVEMNEDSGSSQEEGGLNLTTNRVNRKRKSETFELPIQPSKKLLKELQENYQNHERILAEYIQSTLNSTMPDVVRHIDQILSEIHTVSDMIKMKEQEWNNLIHLLKIKEEILMRLTRRKEILEMNDVNHHETNDITSQCSSSITSNDTTIKLVTTPPRTHQTNINLNPVHLNNSGLMMVPIVTSNAPIFNPVSQSSPMPKIRIPALPKQNRMQHILPKPPVSSYSISNQTVTNPFHGGDLNGHPMGRQGPIKDVKSIIADYRQRHPEAVPRRGRRMKSILNPHLVGTTSDNMITSSRMTSAGSLRPGLGTVAETRMSELGLLLTAADGNSRPSSADSSHSSSHTTSTAIITPQHATTTTSNAVSFKDVLVEFAKMSQSERQDAGNRALLAQNTAAAVNAAGKLPPAYPEVTLHPVAGSEAIPGTSHGNSSLLHGILTKSPLRPDARLTPFSPTLARLLTAPERVMPHNSTVYQRAAMTTTGCINSTANITVSASSGMNLSLGQTRSEITITPLPPNAPATLASDLTSNSSIAVMSTTANKPEIMNLDDYEADDSNGRLVIDEEELDGGDHNGSGNAVDDVEVSEVTDGVSVPACQGCNRLEAHYVCAGCGNQWYCSRECQVKAWEVHSEVCKG